MSFSGCKGSVLHQIQKMKYGNDCKFSYIENNNLIEPRKLKTNREGISGVGNFKEPIIGAREMMSPDFSLPRGGCPKSSPIMISFAPWVHGVGMIILY